MIPQVDLEQTFDGMWKEIRGAPAGSVTSNLYSDNHEMKPPITACCLPGKLCCLRKVPEQRFQVEAWKMLAYTLNADERYEEALPYYDRAIHRLEEIGEQPGCPAEDRICRSVISRRTL